MKTLCEQVFGMRIICADQCKSTYIRSLTCTSTCIEVALMNRKECQKIEKDNVSAERSQS